MAQNKSNDRAHQTSVLAHQTSTLAQQTSVLAHQTSAIADRLSRDEQIACYIQALALPANKQLVVIMQDIHTLLTVPLTVAQRRQRAAAPPSPKALRALGSLNTHLASFLALTKAQPATRNCAF